VLAQAGAALRVDFCPLRSRRVQLPSRAIFCVLHCGVSLNKAATSQYNERVVECRLAAQMLAIHNGLDYASIRTLGQLATRLDRTPAQMTELVVEHLHKHSYTFDELISALGVDVKTMRSSSLSGNTQHMTAFKLHHRALHVYSEADRVDRFERACLDDDLQAMGQAMRASHASCRDLYECSCKELDELVDKCDQVGAIGARLTGAGWGGCVVALVSDASILDGLPVLFASVPMGGLHLMDLHGKDY